MGHAAVYMVDIHGSHVGQVRLYHKTAAENAAATGWARAATEAEIETGIVGATTPEVEAPTPPAATEEPKPKQQQRGGRR